jgi:hypothetical protein
MLTTTVTGADVVICHYLFSHALNGCRSLSRKLRRDEGAFLVGLLVGLRYARSRIVALSFCTAQVSVHHVISRTTVVYRDDQRDSSWFGCAL